MHFYNSYVLFKSFQNVHIGNKYLSHLQNEYTHSMIGKQLQTPPVSL